VRFPPPTLLLALCQSRQQAEEVQARLTGWLAPRGLAFNQDKTRITHLDQGVDFLGFEIRRFGGKLLTKPSRDALRQIRKRLSAEVTALRGANADAVIGRLNPIIAGSPGVVKLSHDVAPDVRRRAFATRLDRCGGRSCR
jgi:RNA-directed DNA polymerase